MKIFGHPAHIILIHFPSALFPMDVFCSALFLLTGEILYAHASLCASVGGAALGWIAVVLGGIDLIRIPAGKTSAVKRALIHGSINTSVVIAYSVFAVLALRHSSSEHSVLFAGAKGLVVMGMMVGNFLGGNLVLKDGLGMIE